MEKLGLNELREMFHDFYSSKGHYKRKSFSLVPEKDKSLLIINSGMAPLKPYFAGIETPPAKRMTTCQKCIRTGDIENVGYTSRHATFFEMLGSFSFGDYFKLESITWGWEFITKVLKMPEDKLWASVYLEDDEAYGIWKDVIGIPENRIVKLGKEDNFWEIGTGPCGPCSEIYYDRGERYGCDNPNCAPGCDCDRYVEFWNHVFTQFSRDDEGNYTLLAHPNIDTGMGLERLACIMQGVDSIFDIDTIRAILTDVTAKAGIEYKSGEAKTDVSIRIITDHIRSVVFMISDGIIPSNEGRGYVLRRLLRRAARHGKLLGIEGSFLPELAKKVIEVSSGAYPELSEKSDMIDKLISVEEEKFAATIDQGTAILTEYMAEIKAAGETTLTGSKVFRLYDTFGFPLELTQEILEENGCRADIDGFEKNMLHQKETARAARKNQAEEGWAENTNQALAAEETVFTGYETLSSLAVVKGIFKGEDALDYLEEGQTAGIVLDQTSFYAESGGQAFDMGNMENDSCMLEVSEVFKVRQAVVHKVKMLKGTLKVGDSVSCTVSALRRNSIARNHTATHLLHSALRQVVGDHVQQAGSSVTAEGLRFDFSNFDAVTKENLDAIERIVNEKIDLFLPVVTEEMTAAKAAQSGAMALFDEKYGESVRVVSIGEFSKELCGGTHVSNSGQIGAFKILSEGGVAAGIRRIEAISGNSILQKLKEKESVIQVACETLKATPSVLVQKISALSEEIKSMRKELDDIKRQAAGGTASNLVEQAKKIGEIRLITSILSDYDVQGLRSLSDEIRANYKGVIAVFATEKDGKVTFLVSVTDDLLEKGYHAGNMIKQIAAAAGGGGGGKADMAQAGAKDPSKISEAFAVAETIVSA